VKEAAIVSKIRAVLEDLGAYVEKNHGSQFQHRGRPDLEGCLKGQFIAFEVKQPGQEPEPLQALALELIRRAGGKAAAVHSVEEARSCLYAWGFGRDSAAS
jgi:hypothetical protein